MICHCWTIKFTFVDTLECAKQDEISKRDVICSLF